MKKLTAMLLALTLALSLAGCGQKKAEAPAPQEPAPVETPAEAPAESETPEPSEPDWEPATYSIAALKGPTAMGLVKLMSDAENGGDLINTYNFTLAGAADEVTPALIKGELDMACVPANLASVLYNKTEGKIQVLAVNTLGVIYIVENGEEIGSMEDLRGKTIVAAGKGATPEFGLRYLLQENGIDPDNDVNIEWKSEHAECVAALASGQATIAMLPQPFVTVAQTKIEGLRVALDLTAEWDALDNGSGMITGVIVGRKDVTEANPAAVWEFLSNYADSVNWVNENVADAAALISQYGIVEAAPVAQKALPFCNIVCITGDEMQAKLSGYLDVLAQQAPESVGGKVPAADFYFGA